MKKILLGTTTLIGAATLLAGAALAEDPKVMLGGVIDFQGGWMSDDLDSSQREYGFRNDTEVNVAVDGRSDSGLGYGAVIDLEADVTSDSDSEGVNASRTYVHLDGGFGRFEMGSNTGAAQTMKVDASNLARATGGIDGDWTYWANGAGGPGTTPGGLSFITTPSLPLAHGSTTALGNESTDNDNKITYYSPRFSGFQLGLSYTPDSADRGQTVSRTETTAGESGDNFDIGLGYEGQWDQVGLNLGAASQWGDSESAATEDLNAYNLGATVSFSGFSLGGSWGDWDDSLGSSSVDADYYTLGGAYDSGQFGVSVTWLDSNIDSGATDNDFNNLVVGADYALASGLTPYAEVSFYEFDAPGTASDNDGTVFLIGTELAF